MQLGQMEEIVQEGSNFLIPKYSPQEFIQITQVNIKLKTCGLYDTFQESTKWKFWYCLFQVQDWILQGSSSRCRDYGTKIDFFFFPLKIVYILFDRICYYSSFHKILNSNLVYGIRISYEVSNIIWSAQCFWNVYDSGTDQMLKSLIDNVRGMAYTLCLVQSITFLNMVC